MQIYYIAVFVSTLLIFQGIEAAPKNTGASAEQVSRADKITTESVCELTKNYVEVNSILATISRHPSSTASEIETRLTEIRKNESAPKSSRVFAGYAQTILKNRRGLKSFQFLERAGLPRFEQVVCAKPELFAPLFSSFVRVVEHTAKDVTPADTELPAENFEIDSPNEADQNPQTPLAKFKQLVLVNTVLAKVARTPSETIAEVDAAIAHLQETAYPENTIFGKSLGRMRILLKNHSSLAWFDFLDRAGLGKLENLIVSKPSMFEEPKSAGESVKQN